MSDFDASRIDGMFSEPVVLPEHRLALGLMHLAGAGIRVCSYDGSHVRHMSQAAARRLAGSLEAPDLAPVADALQRLADRIDVIQARVAAQRAQTFAEMPVEGNA